MSPHMRQASTLAAVKNAGLGTKFDAAADKAAEGTGEEGEEGGME